MGNLRQETIIGCGRHGIEKCQPQTQEKLLISSELFGIHVFNQATMHRLLPKNVFENVTEAMQSASPIDPLYADTIALAMKDWAVSHGATHYTHWFQPLTGASAEKHDSFIDFSTGLDGVLEQFSGKQLIQGEPDASSFPSGGLRSTYEARGYTGWDPTSPVFLWKAACGVTLCIPSVFFSWTGEALDAKIPLLRSDEKLKIAALRLLKYTGIKAKNVYSTLGLEQEYFVVDRSLRNLRPDLLLLGKTVFGAAPPVGQELQDHYLGSVKDRILNFMIDFETEALKLGIPVKTRHNEVAPAQHEVAPLYEKASKAVDHNLLLMELMRHIAVKHQLSCLLHEKPFKGFNGSGKHSNWSLSTDTGMNLLDPSENPGNNLHFLILLTAILHAVHAHSALLRASIGSYSNDSRLGGHEAPPAIISVYLGSELEAVLDGIVEKGYHPGKGGETYYDLGSAVIAHLKQDSTDRNRTSPFAFTGNKFEFRAVGSSANPSFPTTVLNAVVADSLNLIMNEIENNSNQKNIAESALPILQKYLKLSHPIRFSGDNYGDEWRKSAEKRKLPNLKKSIDAFEAYKLPSTHHIFEGILTSKELDCRYEVVIENYLNYLNIEINLMLNIFQTQVLPAAISFQNTCAKSLERVEAILGAKSSPMQLKNLKVLNGLIEEAIKISSLLQDGQSKALKRSSGEKTTQYLAHVEPLMNDLRTCVDAIEQSVDDQLWPLAKYRELLFLV